jgi:hypothetical protein
MDILKDCMDAIGSGMFSMTDISGRNSDEATFFFCRKKFFEFYGV